MYFLSAMSLWFYGYFNSYYLWIIIGSILGNYLLSYFLSFFHSKRSNRISLIVGLTFNLGLLFYFKYYDFFIDNINVIFKTDFNLRHILLPLGISFYTFQSMSYVIDVYRGDVSAQKNWIDLACYVTLFPQLIAGPIVTYDHVRKELYNREIKLKNVLDELFMDDTVDLIEEMPSNVVKRILKSVSKEDIKLFNETMTKVTDAGNKDEVMSLMLGLPDSIISILLQDFKIKGVVITVDDQLEIIDVTNRININEDATSKLSMLEELPDSLYGLIKPSIDMDKVLKLSLIIGILYVTSALLSYIQNFTMTTISNKFAKLLRTNISKKINVLPLKYDYFPVDALVFKDIDFDYLDFQVLLSMYL